ncbi:MAG: hypothetical protein AB7G37_13305 [Solirubrobacteraceae bacterium]
MIAAFRGPRLGVTLMLTLLIGWAMVTITTQFIQAANHGYGSGFGDGGHLSQKLAERPGVARNPEALRAIDNQDREAFQRATNVDNGGGLWHDTWRLVLTLGLIVGFMFGAYLLMSRSGSF